jgi:hypothetical protein
MPLEGIAATPHPSGHRIDLRWAYPPSPAYAGVRVVRKAVTHPRTPDDGALVIEGDGLTQATDEGLPGEVVFYYALFPYQGSPPAYEVHRANRAVAMATARYDFSGLMSELLPRIYHRYDTARPRAPSPDMALADRERGQLRRFLDLPGGQLDVLYSFLRSLLGAHDVDVVDGRLLPLLADWIGWRTDQSRELDEQRREVRQAPSVYATVGIVPTVEATVKRLTGWETRSKEFVHNVFASNRPELLNLWEQRETSPGVWTEPTEPLSLIGAFDGRVVVARGPDNRIWLAAHRADRDRCNIWLKTRPAAPGSPWEPSRPLLYRRRIDKDPSLAVHAGRLWIAWTTAERSGGAWRLGLRSLDGDVWLDEVPPGDPDAERRSPALVSDDAGGLWLFWLEKIGSRWQVRFSRRSGGSWIAPQAPPLDAGADPRVDADLTGFFHPVARQITLFWSRREVIPGVAGERWRIARRTKNDLDPTNTGWTGVAVLPSAGGGDYSDREPAALPGAGGDTILYWSSQRAGSYAVWRVSLAGGSPELVMATNFSARGPAVIADGGAPLLLHRSNRGVPYQSPVYAATETIDLRYSGATTIDVRNQGKRLARRRFEDFETYTYDTGASARRSNDDWVGRDTLGLYLLPTTADDAAVAATLDRLRAGLPAFMPATDRAVFVAEGDLHVEAVYGATGAGGDVPVISESIDSVFTDGLQEQPLSIGEDFGDVLEG